MSLVDIQNTKGIHDKRFFFLWQLEYTPEGYEVRWVWVSGETSLVHLKNGVIGLVQKPDPTTSQPLI